MIRLEMEGEEVLFRINAGADVSVINEHTATKLRLAPKPKNSLAIPQHHK